MRLERGAFECAVLAYGLDPVGYPATSWKPGAEFAGKREDDAGVLRRG